MSDHRVTIEVIVKKEAPNGKIAVMRSRIDGALWGQVNDPASLINRMIDESKRAVDDLIEREGSS